MLQVINIAFLGSGKTLVTTSKEKFLRVWDLDTQHCGMQIISGHHTEIWSIDIDLEERYLVRSYFKEFIGYLSIVFEQ